ncbi:type VI secretion system membrane subunit TssM [Paucibacter sp. R3-3]|uniref:Type VI secretion system membrane subunit TssM n=1 Tax=Roseateles agri TaxID=3098619 RepID=A0ABU5DAL8_9BURK|nr:type VI secretion system membrane subunit TssM [Paucibacter sp. R3-3]MDY0743305.1 type VI secretion system membrane subunit TssM [Paucibacter sp. R3-3]
MIKKLLGWIFNRWTLAAVLFIAIALVLWIVGPLVAVAELRPLETAAARGWAIAVVALLFALRMAWSAWRARRGNAAVVSEMLSAAPAAAAESADTIALRQRFEDAMQTLRETRFAGDGQGRKGASSGLSGLASKWSGRYLYELPWYAIIGAPGSGKTTALQNCGLKFPLAARLGERALKGMGGTRLCDWWFTDQAVVIDTAGRFTTQEDGQQGSGATWTGFLAMLKRTRSRQPLNGVLVTVSVDLLLQGAARRDDYAQKVRQRVQELHEQLGIRFPIYLLVTKTDLLAGFMDYFATLDKDQRATPWGVSFPLQARNEANLQSFSEEFDALQRRLQAGLVERLQSEPDAQRRARIYGFPNQFARLQGMLQEFLETVFAPSRFEADPLLRGVYFISGTQEGTPIDRVLGTVARAFRIESAVMAPNQASGRSYFLSRLLGEVVFAENGLAGLNRGRERRLRWLSVGTGVSLAAVAASMLTAWGVSYLNNRRYVDDVAARVGLVDRTLKKTPNRATPDLLPILPALDATRDLARDAAAGHGFLGFGLEQVGKLDLASRAAYQRMLVDAMLPRLGLRVEDQLRLASASGQGQYEALKTYVMLHDAEHFDRSALATYFQAGWDAEVGRSIDANQAAELNSHLAALLTQDVPLPKAPADSALIESHQRLLAQGTLPQRIYSRMRQQGLGAKFPDFTLVRAAGDRADLVFVQGGGVAAPRGVPGLFSYDGYHHGFQPQVTQVTEQLASEQPWVLGVGSAPKDAAAQIRADGPLIDDVRRLYLNDYVAAWERFIGELKLRPRASMAESIQMAQLLSGSDSPLPKLLRAISHETTLLAPDSKGPVDRIGDRFQAAVKATRETVAGAIEGGGKPAAGAPAQESIVDDRFRDLRRMVTAPEGGKPPVDDVVALVGQVQVLLSNVDNAVKAGTAPPPFPVTLQTTATQLPQPLRAMLEDLTATGGRITQMLTRQNLSADVKAQVGEFCQQAVAGRYPIDRTALRDATQADFATLFAPGGKFDQMQQKLAPLVDTAARPTWRFRDGENGRLGADAGSLPEFQRAQAIRETFFPVGNVPTLRLQFKPIEMDATLKQFVLDVDGQIVRYDHGPQIPVQVQWPGPRGGAQVRLELSPPASVGATGMVYEGPWALLHLFDHVKIEKNGPSPERFRATFDIDGRKAVFEITAGSVRNPFRLAELTDFSCPLGL